MFGDAGAMTQFALTLPLDRVSPIRVPTRDLVLGGTDSVTLNVSIVDRDSPDAPPIELSGGIGGPAVSMFVWPDHRGGYGPHFGGWGSGDDYGWGGWYGGGVAGPGTVLWSATGVILDMTTGTFQIHVPPGTMGCWPRRCRWAIYFDADAGGTAELLSEGHLHVRSMVSRAQAPLIMLTDPNPAALTDTSEAIFLAGAPSPGFASVPSGALPIASVTTLGGIKVDGETTMTDPTTGLLTTIARLG
jgi:hypothetical protein